jgi:hypothetical protein
LSFNELIPETRSGKGREREKRRTGLTRRDLAGLLGEGSIASACSLGHLYSESGVVVVVVRWGFVFAGLVEVD